MSDWLGDLSPDRDLTDEEALVLGECTDLRGLMRAASARRDAIHGSVVSYSRKVFVPLTQLCRDVCHYCTFAHAPGQDQAPYLSLDEVLKIARAGQAARCKEVLFTLGDKPELRYPAARMALDRLGHDTTISYLENAARTVVSETGLLPHVNPGCLTASDLAALRLVSISQGIMLESASERLCEPGQPHHGSPDKLPSARLATIRMAGEQRIPFTTGILIGIGETRRERVEALLALRALHDTYGHLQEIIIQNFRPKLGTRMAGTPAVSLDEHLWTIAVARLLFPSSMNVQAPPNLNAGALAPLIAAGINDWGGVSPVTPDHVNPEAPWPHLKVLERATKAAGKELVERLAIYPGYARSAPAWVDKGLQTILLHMTDADGWPRTDEWAPGMAGAVPHVARPIGRATGGQIAPILARVTTGQPLDEHHLVRLFQAKGDELSEVCAAADSLRREVNGNVISYVLEGKVEREPARTALHAIARRDRQARARSLGSRRD
jgi:FO synthase